MRLGCGNSCWSGRKTSILTRIMAWSTRELADLAGTTVNTIRHYHQLGLLEQPERRYNGYKQYGVSHLVCLLRIRRLADLGVPLFQIGDVSGGGDADREVLRELDAELSAKIDRLTSAREDIALILRDDAPADAPAGFSAVAARLSEADTSILHVYSRLYDAEAMTDLQQLVAEDIESNTASREVDDLSPDADEATRQRLAEAMAPLMAKNITDYPWLREPGSRFSTSEEASAETIVAALLELYNPAQLDVFHRASLLARELLDAQESTSDEDT